MVQDWSSNHKKRRERQLSFLKREKQRSNTDHLDWDKGSGTSYSESTLPWNSHEYKNKRGNRFLWQVLISCSFLFFTYLVLQSHSPVMKPAGDFVYEVMTREFNFAGCADIYNRYVGNTPSILPVFSSKISTDQPSDSTWKVPVIGKIVLPYDSQRKGVVIHSAPAAQVAATAEGRVIFAGYKQGLGNTVIIRHANEQETWYGWLGSLDVKEKDWVRSGQELGDVSLTKGQPLLYFALKKKQQFINPAVIVPFNE